MPAGVAAGLIIALVSALAAVLGGRNLTRSITACVVGVVGLAVALLAAGAGFIALFVATVAALVLATLQLFGWMLVDVDRDHLPETDRMTWFARCLAFVLLGGGLALLVLAALDQGLLESAPVAVVWAGPTEVGGRFFGAWRDLASLCGLALSAGLLATLMMLGDDGEKR